LLAVASGLQYRFLVSESAARLSRLFQRRVLTRRTGFPFEPFSVFSLKVIAGPVNWKLVAALAGKRKKYVYLGMA